LLGADIKNPELATGGCGEWRRARTMPRLLGAARRDDKVGRVRRSTLRGEELWEIPFPVENSKN